MLTLLIKKYDEQHNKFALVDPITLLKSLMKEHKLKAVDLAKLLQVSEGLVSDILNYKKGLSKETIRMLAGRFKPGQEAFNRHYELEEHLKAKPVNIRRKKIWRNSKSYSITNTT